MLFNYLKMSATPRWTEVGRETNNSVKNWAEDLNGRFSKEGIQMVSRFMKRCSTPLLIRETQVKTTVRYHLTPDRMAFTKKPTNNKCWTGRREKRTLLHCWWECKFVQPLMKNSVNAPQKTKNRITIWPTNPKPGYIPRQNYNSIQYMHPYVHNSQNIHSSQNMKTT